MDNSDTTIRGGDYQYKGVGKIKYEMIDENIIYIEWFEIDEGFRGRGFGRKMFDEFEKFVGDKGNKKICLDNENGNEFWGKIGFKKIIEDGEEIWSDIGLCMEKDIIRGK